MQSGFLTAKTRASSPADRHPVLASLAIPPFVPSPLFASGHVQTLVASCTRVGHLGPGERVLIPIEGGSLVARHHRAGEGSSGCVMVIHGIIGDAHESFVRRTARL